MTQRTPIFVNAEGVFEELGPTDSIRLSGEHTEKVPLPKSLAQLLFLCQGRGVRISADYQLLAAGSCIVTPDHLCLNEGVRNLRIWLDDVVWEWDSAGQAWLQHKVYREDT